MLGNHYLTKAQKLEERAKRVYLPIWRALFVATENEILFACFSYIMRIAPNEFQNWIEPEIFFHTFIQSN